jgi:hypothetical protein
MNTVARFLLAALLALAVPLQGALAVTGGQCMALGQNQDAPGQESHTHAASGDHGHAAHAHSHADGSGSPAADADSGGSAHCGPCTACCASASIAGYVALAIASDQSHAEYVFSQSPPIGVQPDGLDRPPLAL